VLDAGAAVALDLSVVEGRGGAEEEQGMEAALLEVVRGARRRRPQPDA